MRINRPWKPHKWLPVLMAMPPMVKELEAAPESGFLGASQGLPSGGPALVQYWRSFGDLDRLAQLLVARVAERQQAAAAALHVEHRLGVERDHESAGHP